MKYRVKIGHDADCENPCDNCGAWKIYSFSNRHTNYRNPYDFLTESGKIRFEYQNKYRNGLLFPLQYFEHGLCRWDISGHGPRCRWDSVQLAGVAVWEESPANMGAKTVADRAKDLSAQLEEYSNWCNGQCYWFEIENAETGESLDSCAGFIGDYVIDGIRESLPDDATEENTEISSQYGFCAYDLFKPPKTVPA